MKVHKLIETLQKLDGELDVWVSGDGINYGVADDVAVDDVGDVVILGDSQREY